MPSFKKIQPKKKKNIGFPFTLFNQPARGGLVVKFLSQPYIISDIYNQHFKYLAVLSGR